MTTAVERAADVIEGFGGNLGDHAHMLANALADAGLLIPEGESETRVEYGVRMNNGGTMRMYGDQEWVRTEQALEDLGSAADRIMQRTVTTHRGEWTEISDA